MGTAGQLRAQCLYGSDRLSNGHAGSIDVSPDSAIGLAACALLPSPSTGAEVVAVEDQRQGWRLRHRAATGRRPALACDLRAVTGCPARGGRPSALAGVATRVTARYRLRRVLADGPAAAATPAGLPPERAWQRCRPVTPERQRPQPATADVAPIWRAGCPPPALPVANPGRLAAGAVGALETVKKVLTETTGQPLGSR